MAKSPVKIIVVVSVYRRQCLELFGCWHCLLGKAPVPIAVQSSFEFLYSLIRPFSHKLLIINNYVNCRLNFAFALLICLFHPLIFEKILMRIRSIVQCGALQLCVGHGIFYACRMWCLHLCTLWYHLVKKHLIPIAHGSHADRLQRV